MAIFGYFQGRHDLDFDPTWPIVELDLDIIEIQLVTKFGQKQSKNVTARALTPKLLTDGRRTDGRRTPDKKQP